jgi:hypothetical protein
MRVWLRIIWELAHCLLGRWWNLSTQRRLSKQWTDVVCKIPVRITMGSSLGFDEEVEGVIQQHAAQQGTAAPISEQSVVNDCDRLPEGHYTKRT